MEFWPEGLRKSGFPPETVLSELEGLGFSLHRIDERTGDVEKVGDRKILLEGLTGSGYANLLAVSGGGAVARDVRNVR